MNHPYAECYAKIARAKRLITELSDEQARLCRDHPLAWEQVSTNPSKWELRTSLVDSMNLSSILGDVVHNLRASLDLAVNVLAVSRQISPRDMAFPFADSEDKFKELLEKTGKRKPAWLKLGADAVKVISELEPYSGGNDDLRGLHDLDIVDKHVSLIETRIHPLARTAPLAEVSDDDIVLFETDMSVVLSQNKRYEHRSTDSGLLAPFQVYKFDHECYIFLISKYKKNKAHFAGAEVVDMCQHLCRLVGDIVDTFARNLT